MKRIISCLLAVALLLTLVMPVAMAADERKSGAFTYRIKGNGTAVIIGYDWESHQDEEIYIPRMLDGYTVTEIGAEAFIECRKIKGVVIPDTVVSIGERAFFDVEIDSVAINIPASVQYIGAGALNMDGLKTFNVDSQNSVYATIDGVLYNKKNKELVRHPSPFGDTFKLPEGIKRIGAYAYHSVYLGEDSQPWTDSVEYIGEYAFFDATLAVKEYITLDDKTYRALVLPSKLNELGEGAFCNADLCRVNMVDLSKTQLTEVPDKAFYELENDGSSFDYLMFPITIEKIGKQAFSNTGFIQVDFPSSLKYIKESAFEHSFLKAVSLPEGLKELGSKAFYDSIFLYDISLPSSLTEIGNDICDKTQVTLSVQPGTYAALWASENGYFTDSGIEEDTSWLND